MEKCENCKFGFSGDKRAPPHCRRNPPEALAVPMQNKITGAPEMQINPLPHPLSPTGWCGEYKAALTIEQ